MIGKSITTIIPIDRLNEETEVLSRIRRGESVDHFETIRQRKDGSLIPISLTVSPIRREDRRRLEEDRARHQRPAARRGGARSGGNAADQSAATAARARPDRAPCFESPQLRDVLPAMIALARSLLDADAYTLWRLNAVEGIWEVAASMGLSDSFASNVMSTHQANAIFTVPLTEPLVVHDVRSHPLLEDRKAIFEAEGVHRPAGRSPC